MEETSEEETIRQAMSLIGRRTSERKKVSSAENLEKARANRVVTPEMREKMKASQKARWERYRAEEAAAAAERAAE